MASADPIPARSLGSLTYFALHLRHDDVIR